MSSASHNTPISQNSGSFNSPMIGKKLCDHGVEADVLTSMSHDNPAKRFYRCRLRKHNDCGLFVWIDPDLPPYQRSCFAKLKAKKESLEEQMKCKDVMEKLLSERLDLKAAEVDRMQEYQNELCKNLDIQATINAELEVKVQAAMNHAKALERKLTVVIISLVVVVLFVASSCLFKGVYGIGSDRRMLK